MPCEIVKASMQHKLLSHRWIDVDKAIDVDSITIHQLPDLFVRTLILHHLSSINALHEPPICLTDNNYFLNQILDQQELAPWSHKSTAPLAVTMAVKEESL